MDAVIQVEVSTLECRAVNSYVEVVGNMGETTFASTWITVLIDQLRLIKGSLWANAPNENIPHSTMEISVKVGSTAILPAFTFFRSI